MKSRREFIVASAALAGSAVVGSLAGCAHAGGASWTTLIDGGSTKNLDGFSELGAGHWSLTEGTLQGKSGKEGFLLTRESYADFEIHAEFWADEDANSGIFLRCENRAKVSSETAYEVNIFDKRPDPSYGTGAIVNVAKVFPMPKAANRWNTLEITARGDHLTVVLNGVQTADGRDSKHKSGAIALQSAAGTIRFRTVQIRSI